MIDEEKDAWIRFLTALEEIQGIDDYAERRSFLETFRPESVLISTWLNKLKITGGRPDIAIDPPSHCDLCGTDLSTNALFIDGQIKDSRWSFMCLPCFSEQGTGISWGVGQLFKLAGKNENGDPRWVCIAGGNTDPE